MSKNDSEISFKHETEHIVAILDLLGASERIKSTSSESVLNAIMGMFRNAASNWPYLENVPNVLHDIKCVTFSDNIAFSLDLSELLNKEEAIVAFIKYVSVFQGVALKNCLLFRGGITIGPLYMDSQTNFVWGKALVDAHQLEEKVAVYPRVVLSEKVKETVQQDFAKVLQDLDGIYFVDYVTTVKKLYPDWIEKNKQFIETQFFMRKGKDEEERILQKYEWLQNYIEQCEKAISAL